MCVCRYRFWSWNKKKKIYFFQKLLFLDVCLKTSVSELSSWFTFPCESEVLWLQWLCVLTRIFAFIFFSRPRQDVQQPRRHLYVDPKTKVISQDSNGQIKRLPVRTSWRHTRAQPKRKFFITYPYLLTQYGFDLLSARSTSYEGENGWGELGHDVMQNKLLTAFIHVSQCRHRVWESVHAQNNRSHFSKLTLLLFLAVNRAQSWKACSNYELSEQNKTEKKKRNHCRISPWVFLDDITKGSGNL